MNKSLVRYFQWLDSSLSLLIMLNLHCFLDAKDESPSPDQDDTVTKEMLKYKSLYLIEKAKNKMRNARRKTRNEIIEEKKVKRNQREAKLERELAIEKEKVKKEREKRKNQVKLYTAERYENFKLRKKLKTATSEETKSKTEKEAVRTFVEKNFKGRAQRTMLLNPEKKWARSDRDDIVEALTIRTYSPKTFEYLRRNGSLYMPSKRTIERHIDGISTCKSG